MILPSHVNEAKTRLEIEKGHLLEIARTLTETQNLAYEPYLEEMWESIFRAEKKRHDASDNQWVFMFLEAVNSAMEEKPYYSMNGEERKKNLEKIRVCTDQLKNTYKILGLDRPFLLYDPESLGLLDEDGQTISEVDSLPNVGITEALDFYYDFAKEELEGFVLSGKIVERHKSNRFIKVLGQRNLSRYKRPLYSVLVKAVHAIYDEEYSETDALNLIKGRKDAKNPPLQSSLK